MNETTKHHHSKGVGNKIASINNSEESFVGIEFRNADDGGFCQGPSFSEGVKSCIGEECQKENGDLLDCLLIHWALSYYKSFVL